MRNTRLSRVTAALTALAAVAAVAVVGSNVAQAAPPAPGQSLSVASGTETTSFTLNLATGNNFCPGDASTAGGGWRWHQYIVNADLDVETVTFGTLGPALPAGAPAGSVAQNLYSTTGSVQAARSTLATSTGQITGATTLNFVQNVGIGLPAGRYKIGFVCTQAGVVGRYWESRISVVSTGAGTISWQEGWPPAAPTGVTAAGANQSISGSFSPVTAVPAVTGYTVTASPTVGAPTTVNVPAAGPYTFVIPGLVNGTQYSVTVTAANSVGTGPASAPVLATPALGQVPFTPSVSAPSGASPITVSWNAAPATSAEGGNLTGYTVSFVGTPAIAPVTVAAPATSTVVTGSAGDSYTVSVVGNYDNGQTTATGSAALVFVNAQILVQDITVTRPAGALVLTQRCGSFGSAAEYNDPWLGTLAEIPATPGADPTGGTYPIAPRTDGTAPNQVTGTVTPDNGTPTVPAWTTLLPPWASATLDTANFDEYPYPTIESPATPGEPAGTGVAGTVNPFYPTRCGIDLGTARLITTGPAAGQYFWAQGRLNQITVVNTQDVDNGWTLNGRMSNFVSTTDAGDFFSGNLLGWNPEVTWNSTANLDGYDMQVAPGDVRQPQATASTSGLGAASNSTNTTQAQSLATTARTGLAEGANSLGMAVIDARIRLFIPVTADAGTYKGTLTFTAV